uniref:Uncharacterized protein n=1 Tax=Anguilla anguilla TaxID=7936 RepID=A0A0E9PAT1_ANGAN
MLLLTIVNIAVPPGCQVPNPLIS